MNTTKIYGYHGTTLSNAENILSENRFVPSNKKNEWLGTGVYFFAYLGHAKWWIEASRYKEKETCILKAGLEYSDEQLLDLDDPEVLSEVEEVIKTAIGITNKRGAYKGAVDVDGNQHMKWNFVCNLYRQINTDIGITMYTFPTKKMFDFIGYKQTQRQICVSDPSIIKSIERV